MNNISVANKNGLYLSNIGTTGEPPRHPLVYNPNSKKVTYNTAKTFVVSSCSFLKYTTFFLFEYILFS